MDEVISVMHDALGFSWRIQEIRNRLAEAIGLSGPTYLILISIEHLGANGEVSIARVGEHVRLSCVFVRQGVARLVKSGLVRKTRPACDQRRVVLTVTDEGRRLLERLVPVQQPVNDAMFAGLSSEHFLVFADAMASLVRGTEAALALLSPQVEQWHQKRVS